MKRHVITAVLFSIALPVLAQAPPPELVLAQVLGLEPQQVAAIQAIVAERRAAVEPLAAQARPLEEQLGAAMEAGDAARTGALVLSIRALQRQIAEHDQAARRRFVELLTPPQRAQLEAIRGVEAAVRAVEALRLLSL